MVAVTKMKDPQISELLNFAHTLADLAAGAIMPYFRRRIAVTNKMSDGGFDPVTSADRAAERAIRKAIAATYPEHGIIGEEFAAAPGSGRYHWLIDPIDGTRAFITGSPLWGTLIGLTRDGQPLVGVMSQPFTGERFWADTRRGRWRGPDGKTRTLRTRSCPKLSEAVMTSTHPDLFTGADAQAFAALKSRVRMTRFGGDCYGYCMLATGFVDLVVEAGLKPYDVMALIPIIQSAGGVITTWDGKPATDGGRIVAAGDRGLHAEALAVLSARR
jgi:myo-inositol-1(or 4)-monophosphatase